MFIASATDAFYAKFWQSVWYRQPLLSVPRQLGSKCVTCGCFPRLFVD